MNKFFTILLIVVFNVIGAQSFEISPQGYVDRMNPDQNYIIMDFPNKTQAELYKTAEQYLSTIYNNPGYVLTKIDNQEIVVNATANIGSGNLVDYQYIFYFKDGRIKFAPHFKRIVGSDNNETPLIDLTGFTGGVFSKKGKARPIKRDLDAQLNSFIDSFVVNMRRSEKEW